MTAPSRMLQEALEAPARLEALLAADADLYAALAAQLRAAPPKFAFTIARGTSDHAASFAASLIQSHLGRITASLAPSLWTRARAKLEVEGALALAISQSGSGPDVVETTAHGARSGCSHRGDRQRRRLTARRRRRARPAVPRRRGDRHRRDQDHARDARGRRPAGGALGR